MKNFLSNILSGAITGLIMLPFAIVTDPVHTDSSITTLTVTGMTGEYAVVTRGCDNEVIDSKKSNFKEFAISAEHTFSDLHFVVGGGYSNYKDDIIVEQKYNNPYRFDLVRNGDHRSREYLSGLFGYRGKYVGVDLTGITLIRNTNISYEIKNPKLDTLPWGAYIRIGKLSDFHAGIGVNNGILNGYPGTIYAHMTWASEIKKNLVTLSWTGGEVYDGSGLGFKWDQTLSQNWRLETFVRFGGSAGVSENSIGLGLKYRVIKY